MSASNYEELRAHVGHKIVCVVYGTRSYSRFAGQNAAIECETCNEVLLDFDKEEEITSESTQYTIFDEEPK